MRAGALKPEGEHGSIRSLLGAQVFLGGSADLQHRPIDPHSVYSVQEDYGGDVWLWPTW